MWLKGLVSIACLAVIAVTGIWLFDRFSAEAMPLNDKRMDCWHYANEKRAGFDQDIVAEFIERDCPNAASYDATPAEVENVCEMYRSDREKYMKEDGPEMYDRLLQGCP